MSEIRDEWLDSGHIQIGLTTLPLDHFCKLRIDVSSQNAVQEARAETPDQQTLAGMTGQYAATGN